jgi:ribonuclease HI
MTLHIYVDGSGAPKGKYGYFVEETGKSFVQKDDSITNNEAEYLAILQLFTDKIISQSNEEYIVYSDSQLIVNQINHVYAINNEKLRAFATKIWEDKMKYNYKMRFEWIPRKENKAGKLLGS